MVWRMPRGLLSLACFKIRFLPTTRSMTPAATAPPRSPVLSTRAAKTQITAHAYTIKLSSMPVSTACALSIGKASVATLVRAASA